MKIATSNKKRHHLFPVSDIRAGVATEKEGVYGWPGETSHYADEREFLVQGQIDHSGGHES